MRKWSALVVLSLAQFLMVLDQAVMNVSITRLVDDFDTSITTIQGVITFYSLTMATLMITGAKLGDILGRRRAFVIGHLVYGAGSALTAVSWNVGSLLVGWSLLEGVGAALVLPALVALVTANYDGPDRLAAFGVIGGVAGAGIAVGPIVGGYFTANLSWRWVFVGEVVTTVVILALARRVADAPTTRVPRLDVVGAVLAATGLGAVVVGVLQSSTWGWLTPRRSPVEPLGYALTPFVVVGGVVLVWAFVRWQERRNRTGSDPLVTLSLLSVGPVRAGLSTFLAQNTILLGIFFTLPLYFQIVLGQDALETGLRMLPISVAMFVASASGPVLARHIGPRRIVQAGFGLLLVAAVLLVDQVRPDLRGGAFAFALVVLGVGMGLVASQLGNVIQSSVEAAHRGEAGGLQYTAQQLGSALGTALIGAVVVAALSSAFLGRIAGNEDVSPRLADAVTVRVGAGVSFVPADEVERALAESGVDDDEARAVVDDYEGAQLAALRSGLLLAGAIALGALGLTRRLPADPVTDASAPRKGSAAQTSIG